MLNTATSIGAISRSMRSTSAIDLVFLARVGREAVRLPALGADALDQRLELVGAAPRDAGDESLAREAARDRAAGGVARADDQHRLGFSHSHPPHVQVASTPARRVSQDMANARSVNFCMRPIAAVRGCPLPGGFSAARQAVPALAVRRGIARPGWRALLRVARRGPSAAISSFTCAEHAEPGLTLCHLYGIGCAGTCVGTLRWHWAEGGGQAAAAGKGG